MYQSGVTQKKKKKNLMLKLAVNKSTFEETPQPYYHKSYIKVDAAEARIYKNWLLQTQ